MVYEEDDFSFEDYKDRVQRLTQRMREICSYEVTNEEHKINGICGNNVSNWKKHENSE